MKTITYNPETHVLVPREPTRDMVIAGTHQRFRDSYDAEEDCYRAMLAAAPQPEPNPNWCAGCSPDNCSGCGAEPVESEPAMWVMKHIRSGDLAQAKPNQKALHPYMLSDAFPRYTTPQPVRVAELEAETTKLKLDLLTSYGEAEELSGKVAELEAALKVARDALDHARLFIRNGIGLGYIRMPDDDCPDPAKSVPGEIFEALAKINEVLHD